MQVVRFHLIRKDKKIRKELIDFCLLGEKKYLALGWSYVYEKSNPINTYDDLYQAVKANEKKIPAVFNVARNAKKDDLFWTRDLEGYYWICRALRKAELHPDKELDISAVIPVEAYKYSMEVPGQIKASFNRSVSQTTEHLDSKDNKIIVEYSKKIFNDLSGKSYYNIEKIPGNILDNLPDFELEELIITYLQIKKNYYVLSNSIANKSTTIKIECELIKRDKSNPEKAVVQVKGGKEKEIDALEYKAYSDDGIAVYLYAPHVQNVDLIKNCTVITRQEILDFYNEYKALLPNSIKRWEDLLCE